MRDHDNDAKLTAGEDVASFFGRRERERDALNRGGFTRDVDVLRPQCSEEDALGKMRKLKRKRKRCGGKK